jgi:hypothetical protein
MEHGLNDIEALVREEKRLSATETQSEAWAEGLSAGIEPEIIAEAALATAFAELVRCSGETAALALLDRMRDKVLAGEFEHSLLRH